jgi:hypothetical protein
LIYCEPCGVVLGIATRESPWPNSSEPWAELTYLRILTVFCYYYYCDVGFWLPLSDGVPYSWPISVLMSWFYSVLITYDFGIDLGHCDVGVSDTWVKRGVQSPWGSCSDPRWRRVLSHHVLCNQYFFGNCGPFGRQVICVVCTHWVGIVFCWCEHIFCGFPRKGLTLLVADAMICRVM